MTSADDQTRRFYDWLSHGYDLLSDSSEHAIRDVGLQALRLSSGQRVLEVGFGTGHGLVSAGAAVGPTGHVYGVDISAGMVSVAAARIAATDLRNVSLACGDARALCFCSHVFDAAFLSFTLELFGSTMSSVLRELGRVLRDGGRVGVVAMADSGHANVMTDVYNWLHHHFPRVVDCQPIDAVRLLDGAGFDTEIVCESAIWGLPVVAVVGVTKR